MENDREKHEKYDNASKPKFFTCPKCDEQMHCTDRILEDYTDKPLRVLFFLECTGCENRIGVYDDGSDYVIEKRSCPECSHEVKTRYEAEGKVITTINKCSHCEYIEKDVTDLDMNADKWERKEKNDRALLRKYRTRYCLSEKEGSEYIFSTNRINEFVKEIEKNKKQAADPIYKRMKKMKMLSVIELEKILSKALSKNKFQDLVFEKPEINKYVMVPFTAQEGDTSRSERDSVASLQKCIKQALLKTNWRLMSEGVNYRLGYLSGRLKGYELEEDLYGLAKKMRG
jgi:hypothetical protein